MDEVVLVSWEDCAAVLTMCYSELGKRLTLGEILPELYSLRTITDYEKQEIEDASKTEYARNLKLVDFLLKKGKREFRHFLQALDTVGRADLHDLLITRLKTELNGRGQANDYSPTNSPARYISVRVQAVPFNRNSYSQDVQRCIIVRSLNEDAELPSVELVSLWLEQQIGLNVDKSWLLDGHCCIVVRFGHDRDRQKALDKGRDRIDNHFVAFEVPEFLNTTEQLYADKNGNTVTSTDKSIEGAATVPQPVLGPAGRDVLPWTETCEPSMFLDVRVSSSSCDIRDQPSLTEAISCHPSGLCENDASMAALEVLPSHEQGLWPTAQCSLSSTERRIEIDGGAVDSTLEETGFALLESHPCAVADTVAASAHSGDLNFGLETKNPQDTKPLNGDAESVPEIDLNGLTINREDSTSNGDGRSSTPPPLSLSLDADSGREFVRLVLGEYHTASQYFDNQDESFLSLLKDLNCSIPVIRADWGNLLVLDCFTPGCLPDNQNILCYIATVVDAFLSSR